MKLRKGACMLTSTEIGKGARLLACLLIDEVYTAPVCIVSLEEMRRMHESAEDNKKSRPEYVAINARNERLYFYPAADKTYTIRQRWQLEYEVA